MEDGSMRRRLLLPGLLIVATGGASRGSDPAREEYLRRQIPTQISGTYSNGALVKMTIGGRNAYVIKPTATVDPQRRWIWIFPFWLGINDGHGALHHRVYVGRFLGAGFHVAGVDVGTSCGSPSAARLCQEFYETVVAQFRLNPKARLVGQSNGGLIAYAWAFRHPASVDRIFGICPATDFRTWPTLPVVITAPAPGLGYDLSLPELTRRKSEFNPVDNLAPLAKAGVKILHIHGDRDELVPMGANSAVLAARYKALGGDAVLDVLKGLGHGGNELYENRAAIRFLLE
jgi:pimeloyl-ACP methyl ester carboxylesterase